MPDTSHKAGIDEEFLAAYDQYSDGIFRFITSKTSDREVGYDLMQETFTKAWDYCASGEKAVTQWKAFLFHTAYNLIVDHYRKKKSLSLDQLAEDDGFIPADNRHSGETITDGAEIARVHRAIQAMDDTYRDILYLRYVEDLPVKQIAEITGLSANAVSVRIHRGMQLLRESMGPADNTI